MLLKLLMRHSHTLSYLSMIVSFFGSSVMLGGECGWRMLSGSSLMRGAGCLKYGMNPGTWNEVTIPMWISKIAAGGSEHRNEASGYFCTISPCHMGRPYCWLRSSRHSYCNCYHCRSGSICLLSIDQTPHIRLQREHPQIHWQARR